jgi:hypothetical protein
MAVGSGGDRGSGDIHHRESGDSRGNFGLRFLCWFVVNALGVLSSLHSLKGDTNLSHIDTKIAK